MFKISYALSVFGIFLFILVIINQYTTPEITPETPKSNIAGHETLPIDKPQEPIDQTGITPEVVQKEPTKFTFTPDEFGMIDDEQLLRAYGDKLPQGLKTALKMNHSYLDDKEGQLHDLFKYGNNLEKQLEAEKNNNKTSEIYNIVLYIFAGILVSFI